MRFDLLRFAAGAAVLGLLSPVAASATPRVNMNHAAVSHQGPFERAPQYRVVAGGITGAKKVSCPSSQYYECVEVSKKTPFTQTWCIVDVTSGSCSSSGDLAPGTWTWNVTNPKKKKTVEGSFDPNPGNPTMLTIKTKLAKSKPNQYTVSFTICNSSSSCLGPVPIGVTVVKKVKGS